MRKGDGRGGREVRGGGGGGGGGGGEGGGGRRRGGGGGGWGRWELDEDEGGVVCMWAICTYTYTYTSISHAITPSHPIPPPETNISPHTCLKHISL